MKKVALFDIDGTIFRSSLVIELFEELVEQKIFHKNALTNVEKEYFDWLNRRGSYEAYIERVVQEFILNIKGVRVKTLQRIAKEVVANQKYIVYRFTRALIARFKKENYFLVAISGSPTEVVSEFAKAYGFSEYYGGEYEKKEGVFTGKQTFDPFRQGKYLIVNKLLEKYPSINLSASAAIGDSGGDISMLAMVGKPIAFNPNSILAAEAKKKRWRIVVERKDVIYELSDFDFAKTD